MGQALEKRIVEHTKSIAEHFGEILDSNINIRLWDGTKIPLGKNTQKDLEIKISDSSVLSTLLRRPTLSHVLELFTSKRIDFSGANLMEFAEVATQKRQRKIKNKIDKWLLVKNIIPLLFAPTKKMKIEHQFAGDETGRKDTRDEKEFIQFHYDVSNEFYELFLDKEMIYSCAYFKTWEDTVHQAQENKMDMICKKLRLKKGDRLLDVGCGWGALACHAAKNYGAVVHGVTLSQKQLDYAQAKVKKLGLEDQVKLELRNYITLDGEYDKISSIGMYEHVGIANYPEYFSKLYSLLREKGILLNHGITRRAKKDKKKFAKISRGNRMILKYIFPGSELDHIGHTVESLESTKFEVHDVESWREHYAKTCKLWCQRLSENEQKAIELVGEEKYRMWLLYLASVSLAFKDGNLRLYQVVASKLPRSGETEVPQTRADLYS